MSEPTDAAQQGQEQEGSSDSPGQHPERAGGGRTQGETAVDDAMGQGTAPGE
ncbi:hypothetical protein ACI789_22690 [Geodermatophilus sp. SYSU D00965]